MELDKCVVAIKNLGDHSFGMTLHCPSSLPLDTALILQALLKCLLLYEAFHSLVLRLCFDLLFLLYLVFTFIITFF